MKRKTPWPLERAELALRHEASLQAERDRADAEVRAARFATENARRDALAQLTEWAMRERNLVQHVFDRITYELSHRAGEEIAERIRSAMLSRAKVEATATDVNTAVVRLWIPAVELAYAHGFSRLDDYPWRGAHSSA